MLEVNSSASNNSEDSEENECNANGSKEDDSSFNCLEENESDAASGAKVDELFAPEGLVYSDDKAYLFEVSQKMKLGFLFPRTLYARILFQVVQQNQM